MADLMPCGHPVACVRSSREGTSHCAWCADLAELAALRARIDAALVLADDLSTTQPASTDHVAGAWAAMMRRDGALIARTLRGKTDAV